MAPRTTDQATQPGGDPEAAAVGSVLASLRGNAGALNQALSGMNDSQLQAVIQAGVDRSITPPIGPAPQGIHQRTDAQNLQNILSAVATPGVSAAQQARVFQQGARTLTDIRATHSPPVSMNAHAAADAQRITQGLTDILNSNTTGVVRELRLADNTGQALHTYLREVISTNPSANNPTIGNMIARLQQGNGLNQDPLTFIHSRDPQTGTTNNARDLGYFSGSVAAAIGSLTEDARARGDMLGNIFTTALSAGTGWATSVPVQVGGTLLGGGINEAVRSVTDEIVSGHSDLTRAMLDLAVPRDASGQRRDGVGDTDVRTWAGTVMFAHLKR